MTGPSSELGRRAASLLAKAGAAVVRVARRRDELVSWAREGDGKHAALPFDLGDESAIAPFFEAVCVPFEPPDILFHAAGANLRQLAEDVTPEGWQLTQ